MIENEREDPRIKEYLYWDQLMNHMKDDPSQFFNGKPVYPKQFEIHLPADHIKPCQLSCEYCHAADTMVLTSELKYKPIQDLRVGDELIGFKKGISGTHWKNTKTKVKWIGIRQAETIKLITNKGVTECTPDHKWLRIDQRYTEATKRHSRNIRWISYPSKTCTESKDFKEGWICGIANGDGCLRNHMYKRKRYGKAYDEKCRNFRLALTDYEAIQRFKSYMPHLKFCSGKMQGTNKELHYIQVNIQSQVDEIQNIMESHKKSYDFMIGFLSGIFDAEGSYSTTTIAISNTDNNIIDRIKKALDIIEVRYGISTREGVNKAQTQIRVSKTSDIIKFFSITNPSITRKRKAIFDGTIHGNAKIIAIEQGSMQDVYSIETGTGNYVANGFVSKNCAGEKFIKALGDWEITGLHLLDNIAGRIPQHIYGGAYTEPLMNPYFMTFMAKTREYGNHFGIHTNGYALKRLDQETGFLTELNRLADGDTISYLQVSLDAATPWGWGKVKRHRHTERFWEVIDALKRAVDIREKAGKGHAIRLGYLISEHTASPEKFSTLVNIAKDIGVDSVRFSIPFAMYNQSFDDVKKYKEMVEVPGDKQYEAWLAPLVSESKDEKPYIFWNYPWFTDIERFDFDHCVYGYFQITLGADGYFYPCSTVSTPTAEHLRIAKITSDIEEFEQVLLRAQDPTFNPREKCFAHGFRGNRMALECNTEYCKLVNQGKVKDPLE